MNGALLQVEGLSVSYGSTVAVAGVSFELSPGETLALVGESGSGKSSVGLALPRLLPSEAQIGGSVRVQLGTAPPVDISALAPRECARYRGRHMGVVFQEPMTALNPLQRVGVQVAECLQVHQGLSRRAALQEVVARFHEVQLPNPETLIHRYPHQLSGGQRQRVVIAMAVANRPALLIADEPTTALDPTVQRRVLQLLKDLQNQHGFGMVFISHDLPVVQAVADSVLVLRAGQTEEYGRVGQVLRQPKAAYTRQLVAATAPPLVAATSQADAPVLLRTEGVSVHYGTRKAPVKALDSLSLTVHAGEVLGIIGESGSGKSTLARVLVGLQPTTEGQVWVGDQPLPHQANRRTKELTRHLQLVFQDPYAALTPHQTIGAAFDEVLRVHGLGETQSSRRSRALAALEEVALPPEALQRYPHAFSGGQRQRLCMARALLVEPTILLLDEAVSALDATVRSQVVAMLQHVKAARGLTFVFISHDLPLVRSFCNRTAVLHKGQLVQIGPTDEVLSRAPAPYTQALLDAVFAFDGPGLTSTTK